MGSPTNASKSLPASYQNLVQSHLLGEDVAGHPGLAGKPCGVKLVSSFNGETKLARRRKYSSTKPTSSAGQGTGVWE